MFEFNGLFGSKVTLIKVALLAMALLAVTGCGDEEEGGVGTYSISIYGEEFIEEEIPAADVVDGWAIDFTRFLIAVDSISATDGSNAVVVEGAHVYDLTEGSGGAGHVVAALEAPAGDYTSLTYRVAPVSAAEAGAGASMDDVAMMVDMGYSVYVEGVATKGGETKTFTWGFTTSTTYTNCETAAKVTADGVGSSQLTIHADHFFYDDLVSEEPDVAFDLIASADTDANGEVTAAELEALDITTQTRYQVGSADISDLWGFIEAQSRTLGHIDGEGHCDTQ